MRSNIYNRIAPIKPSHYRERKVRKNQSNLISNTQRELIPEISGQTEHEESKPSHYRKRKARKIRATLY